jgi:NADH dehydrogenase FAD-containing subunit
LEDGGSLPFDLCLWACGFAPPDLAREAGLEVNAIGQIVTDRALRSSSHPTIVAIGDAAEVLSEPGGRCRMSCAAGRPMGAAAARAIAALASGREPEPFRFGYIHRCISLGREDGLIQFVDAQDAPLPLIWAGARAARWKEYVCRRTIAGIGLTPDLDPPDELPEAIRKLSHELYRTGAPSRPAPL